MSTHTILQCDGCHAVLHKSDWYISIKDAVYGEDRLILGRNLDFCSVECLTKFVQEKVIR
jgi:hypothetical protein